MNSIRQFHNQQIRRRAVVAVQVAVVLPVIVGMTAIAVDLGAVMNARGDMQRAADAAALAAVHEFAYAGEDDNPSGAAVTTAMEYVSSNKVLGHALSLYPASDVATGRAYYDAVANAYTFVPGDTPYNAARVTVRQSEGSQNGQLSLYFAGIFGIEATDVTAQAVAIVVDTRFEEADCFDVVPFGKSLMCHYAGGDDGDDSDSGGGGDSDSDGGAPADSGDSESGPVDDSQAGHTIIVDSAAATFFLKEGDTMGPCPCIDGDSDDSDDSEAGDSSDSDDSQPGDSDGSENGDSDDSDDSEAGYSDDSDDSEPVAEHMVTICHVPPGNPDNAHTITVDSHAVPAHLAHGDSLGECEPEENNLVTICHVPGENPANPFEMQVDSSDVPDHLDHGDTMGACPTDREYRIFLIE